MDSSPILQFLPEKLEIFQGGVNGHSKHARFGPFQYLIRPASPNKPIYHVNWQERPLFFSPALDTNQHLCKDNMQDGRVAFG